MSTTQPPPLSQRARNFARLLIEPNGSLEDLRVLARGAHTLISELADRVDTSVQISPATPIPEDFVLCQCVSATLRPDGTPQHIRPEVGHQITHTDCEGFTYWATVTSAMTRDSPAQGEGRRP